MIGRSFSEQSAKAERSERGDKPSSSRRGRNRRRGRRGAKKDAAQGAMQTGNAPEAAEVSAETGSEE